MKLYRECLKKSHLTKRVQISSERPDDDMTKFWQVFSLPLFNKEVLTEFSVLCLFLVLKKIDKI